MMYAVIVAGWTTMLSCSQEQPKWPRVSVRNENYETALKHGLETIPVARQFQELFPGAHNFYSYYTGLAGPPVLNCIAAHYGRYEFTLQMDIVFDKTRTRVVSYGEPKFYLKELMTIIRAENRTIEIKMGGGLQKRFGGEEWKKLYQARGDFSVLGIELVKDKPVANFELYWKEQGEKL